MQEAKRLVGNLAARPDVLMTGKHSEEARSSGLQPLRLDGKRDGLLYVPTSYHEHTPDSILCQGRLYARH
jgi:hypothetical protein